MTNEERKLRKAEKQAETSMRRAVAMGIEGVMEREDFLRLSKDMNQHWLDSALGEGGIPSPGRVY